MCVINILMYFDAAPKEMEIWTNILHFLRHKMITRRRNRPGQVETDMWLKSQRENGVMPKISRYRLPFKPIVEQPLKDILGILIRCYKMFKIPVYRFLLFKFRQRTERG